MNMITKETTTRFSDLKLISSYSGGETIGYAMEFDRMRADVVGLMWPDIPQNSFTQEFWLQ
jgi:hypothetical protein